MKPRPPRWLVVALVVVATAGCTQSQIRSDVADGFDAIPEAEVEQRCTDLVAFMAEDEPSRDAFEAAFEGLSDEELGETIRPAADMPGVPEGAHEYDGAEVREWLFATWDECAERGLL